MEKYYPMPLDPETFSGVAILERRLVHIPDIRSGGQPRRSIDISSKSGWRAALAVPLIRNGVAIGSLTITRETPVRTRTR